MEFILKKRLGLLLFCSMFGVWGSNFLISPPIRGACFLVLNELDLDTTIHGSKFVEIASTCVRPLPMSVDIDMNQFGLIFINNIQQIVEICRLGGVMTLNPDVDNYFTIGASSKDYKFDNDLSHCQQSGWTQNDFVSAADYPVGIALVHFKKGSLIEDLALKVVGDETFAMQITAALERDIIANLKDFQAYVQQTAIRNCDYFNRYDLSETTTIHTELRDWQAIDETYQEFSINRCSSIKYPFYSDEMLLSFPSPGHPNMCQFGFELDLGARISRLFFVNEDRTKLCVVSYKSESSFQLFQVAPRQFYQDKLDEQFQDARLNPRVPPQIIHTQVTETPVQHLNPCDEEIEVCNVQSERNCQKCSYCHKSTYIKELYLHEESTPESQSINKRDVRPNQHCFNQISEVNSMTPHQINEEFIEFRKICDERGSIRTTKPTLYGHKLIFIEVLEAPSIVFIANLDGIELIDKGNKLYIGTIGKHKFNGKGMTFNDEDVQLVNENDVIPDGNQKLIICALIDTQDKVKVFNGLKLQKNAYTNKYQPLELTQSLKDLIKLYVVDLIVYTSQSNYVSCELAEYLHPKLHDTDYVLRDFDTGVPGVYDFTISRCGRDVNSFSPESFKIATKSPGERNTCNDAIDFLLPRVLNNAAPLLQMEDLNADISEEEEEDIASVVSSCKTKLNLRRPIHALSGQAYHQALQAKKIKTQQTFVQFQNNNLNFGKHVQKLVKLDQLVKSWKEKSLEDPNVNTQMPWEDISHFQDAWLTDIRRYQRHILDPEDLIKPNVKPWFEYLTNPINQEESKYRCRFCYAFFEESNRLDKRGSLSQKPISTIDGFLAVGSGAVSKNRKTILDHANSEIHQQSVQYLVERSANMFTEDLKTSGYFATQVQLKYFEPTMNLFRLIFFEMKHNIPCNVHPGLHDFMTFHKVNVGLHFYDNAGCSNIVKSISDDMHSILVNRLIAQDKPVTIMVDTATVGPKHHFMSIMLRTLENNTPITYLFKLVEVGLFTDAEGHMALIQTAIEEDGVEFTNYFKKNIVSYASDGANIMRGRISGLSTRVAAYVNKPFLMTFHCISHKNNLVFRDIVERKNNNGIYMTRIESMVNKLYTFYSIRSYKRNAGLKDFVETIGGVFYKPKRIFDVRWIASEYSALDTVFKMYFYLASDISNIADPTKDDESKKTAQELLGLLRDRTCILTMGFLLDVMKIFKEFSMDSQKHDKLIIGTVNSIRALKSTLLQLENNEGIFLKTFLADVFCDEEYGCTLAQYLSATSLTYKSITLVSSDLTEHPEFKDFRRNIVTDLIDKISSEFPEENYILFDILDPLNLPVVQAANEFGVPPNAYEIYNYKLNDFMRICRRLGIPITRTLKDEWGKLMESICYNPFYETLRNEETSEFWKTMLALKSIEWTPATRRVVEGVLSLSVSTAIVESSFSITEQIVSDKRRSSLSQEVIEALLRARINARVHWSKWNPHYYVTSWLKKGHVRADDTSRINPKARYAKEPTESELDDYLISSLF